MTTTMPSVSKSPLLRAAAVADQQVTNMNPAEAVFNTALGYIASACLNVAVKLRIPDLISNGSTDLEDLARKAGVNQDALFRILRVLEMSGMVSRNVRRGYELTAAGQLLRRDAAGSLASAIEWISDPLHLNLYSELRTSVETGETTFDKVYGIPFFDWCSKPENAEEAAVFNNAMTSISEMCIPAFLEAYPFESFKQIVDVGGGHGAVLRSILKQHTGSCGTLAEMPSLISAATTAIANDDLTDRCKAVACNFFESVPAGGDLYFMKNIIHDWADGRAIELLRNIRNVIANDGKLLLAEAVLDDTAAPHLGKFLDIEMIAFVGGKERTAEEFKVLLSAAGFALQRVVPTRSPLSLIEAVPC
jgi:DNA-binding HxlR family transcriptional regulator